MPWSATVCELVVALSTNVSVAVLSRLGGLAVNVTLTEQDPPAGTVTPAPEHVLAVIAKFAASAPLMLMLWIVNAAVPVLATVTVWVSVLPARTEPKANWLGVKLTAGVPVAAGACVVAETAADLAEVLPAASKASTV